MTRKPSAPPDPAALAAARRALAPLSGKRRLDAILDAPDPGALVRSLPADELYFTIREIGLSDSVDLVQLASPRQFQLLLDLDAWRQGAFEPRRALPWLRAARAGALEDDRAAARWARKRRALDPELVRLLLRDGVKIHDLKEDEDPEVESELTLRSPEGQFLVEFQVDGTEYLALRGLVDDLYAEEPFMAARVLSSIRWDLPSELEETSLRWRQGRLADLGIPPLEEARSWYARPPARVAPGPGGADEAPGTASRPPGFFMAPLTAGSRLAVAAAALDEESRGLLELQLVGAGNAVLVADGIDPVDLAEVRDAMAGARAMVELGLGALSAGGPAAGGPSGGQPAPDAEVLARTPVKRLFQEGFGRVLALCWRAERLLKGGGAGSRAAPLLDSPLGEVLSALSSRRPRYWTGLDLPRATWGTAAAGAGPGRRFLSEADLSRTAEALDLCEGLAALALEHGLAVRGEGAAPPLSALWLTALANEALGRPFAPAPLPLTDLAGLPERLRPIADRRLDGGGPAALLLLRLLEERREELERSLELAAGDPAAVDGLLAR